MGASVGGWASLGVQFCALFGKNLKCLNMIESLVCAMTCDPTAYTFVAVGGGAGTVRLCGEFSHQLMIECGGLQIPVLGQTFKNFAPTPQVSSSEPGHFGAACNA